MGISSSDQGSPDWLVLDRGSACTRELQQVPRSSGIAL